MPLNHSGTTSCDPTRALSRPGILARTEDGHRSGRWVDLREAAELLDTSTEAVRKRATRGSLRSERHDGRVVVWVMKVVQRVDVELR